MRNHLIASVIIVCFTTFLSSMILAQSNLPQVAMTVTIKGKQHRTLQTYFQSLREAPEPIDSAVERTIVNLMPKKFRDGCRKMISSWGKVARGSAASFVRALYVHTPTDGQQRVLLTFVCYSRSPEYAEKYYDERLVLLTIDSASSTLATIPHGSPCDNCSDLTRIAVGDPAKIGGQTAIPLTFSSSTENPCCDGVHTVEEEFYRYYVFEPAGIRQMLSLLKHRREVYHDDVEGDSITSTQSEVTIEKDEEDNIVRVTASVATTSTGQPTRMVNEVYVWNRKMKKFEQVFD